MKTRLQTWEWETPRPEPLESLVLDFTAVDFMEPWALAMFTAFALGVRHREKAPVKVIVDESSPSNRYFVGMGLLEVIESGRSTSKWDAHAHNTGLHVIRTHDDVTRFYNSAVRLGNGPGADTMDAVMYAMAELGRNVVQHAFSEFGGIAIAQHFPNSRRVQVAICDQGQGVLSSLSPNYPELRSDLEALKFSLLPHVSGAAQSGMYHQSVNAGLGLFFSKEICWRAGGSIWIGSRRALIGIKEEDLSGRNRVYRSINLWPGTIVALDIPDDGVPNFDQFLKICRDLAQKAREASGPSGLDFLATLPELEDNYVIRVHEFLEDIDKAVVVRESIMVPRVMAGQPVILDFSGTRFVTQSFMHALLNGLLKRPGSLARVSFVNCTNSTKEAIQAVAAYAASYRQVID
jgi:anti-sigma regulatory factor (Ser/Thr protein kinase)/anti-anti-sigma regulatory factor